MENDPIESDDAIEECLWHAQEHIQKIEAEMRALKQKYASLYRLRVQWQDHARALQDAQRTRGVISRRVKLRVEPFSSMFKV